MRVTRSKRVYRVQKRGVRRPKYDVICYLDLGDGSMPRKGYKTESFGDYLEASLFCAKLNAGEKKE